MVAYGLAVGLLRPILNRRASACRLPVAATMLEFSTDALAPEDRFAHWCEVRGKGLFGVTIELERDRRRSFRGRFAARQEGAAVVSQMQASSYGVSRTAADIARMPGHSLCLSLQVRGAGWLQAGRSDWAFIDDGDLLISHSDMPYKARPRGRDGFEYRLLKIPLSADLLLGARAEDLCAARLPPSAPVARPLGALFRAFARDEVPEPGADAVQEDRIQRDRIPGDAIQRDAIHLARLALMARGRLPMGTPEGRAALRAGLLQAAREILARDFARPALSPEVVARELGISVRQVHVLFEPTGRSFMRTLTALRVRAAAGRLRARPRESVAEVAFACGFASLSVFYRAFQDIHAMAPGDMRRAAG